MNKTATATGFAVNPDLFTNARKWSNAEKVARQCENPACPIPKTFILRARQLDWAHAMRGTAHKDVNDNRVMPTQMIKTGPSKWEARYGKDTILKEASKCIVLCKVCHAGFTEDEED